MNFRTIYQVGVLIVACAVASGQTPAPPPKAPKPPAAPQVVTIIHRLNGLKMFRLLLRSEQVQSIDALDSAFNLMDDVHTNVIAGLAMDDGETIAAWLPEADVEFGAFSLIEPNFQAPGFPSPDLQSPNIPAPVVKPKAAFRAPSSVAGFGSGFFASPDVTVIGSDGKPLKAKY